ncbi:unnamed protein product [Closterium sp. Naga37s-1]|nr:unnamed protein product [Closterium sp. Naga37s-1]
MEESDAAMAVRVLKERLTWQPSAVTSRGERGENVGSAQRAECAEAREGAECAESGGSAENAESALSDSIRRMREVPLTAENESNRERLHGMLRDVACDGLCLSLLLLGPRGCGKTLHAARRGVRRALPLAASSRTQRVRQDTFPRALPLAAAAAAAAAARTERVWKDSGGITATISCAGPFHYSALGLRGGFQVHLFNPPPNSPYLPPCLGCWLTCRSGASKPSLPIPPHRFPLHPRLPPSGAAACVG